MKLSKKTILIGISTLVVAGAGLAYYFLTKDNEAVLSWKDGSWLYRKSISVANSGSTLTNEEVLIEVDTATLISNSKLQSTCADLRFTDSDDSTYLAYWVEGGCNTATTQVWVRIPSLTAGGKTIYMYYGNPSASSNEETWAGKFILMKDAACDSGWATESASGGDFYQRFPLASASYGATGGSSSHDHGSYVMATSTVSIGSNTSTGTGKNQAGAHSHNDVTFVTQTASNVLPPYLNMIFCSNTELVIKQDMVTEFDTTVPSGFTRFSALDNKFPIGEATYGGTSTVSTHSHTIPAVTTSGLSASRTCASSYTSVPSSTHTHTFAAFSTGNSSPTGLPVYKTAIYGQANTDIKGSSGIITMTNVVPPMGWTQYSALDGYFPYGSATFGSTGGAATHNHSIGARTSSAYSGAVTCSTSTPRTSLPRAHTHTTATTTTNDVSNNPPYIETIFIQKKTSQAITLNGEEMKNEAPTAPSTLQTEGATNPTSIVDFTPEFSAIFNDPNPTDSASYYQIQVNTASDFTGTSMWDSTQTSLSPVVANGARSQDISYAGTTLQEGTTYYWRIMFWDNNTTQGILSSPWSANGQFTMNISPNAPSSLYAEGTTNPIGVADFTPEFSAVFSDTNSSDVGSYYQIEVNTASDFTGTVMWDSTKTSLSPTIVNGARSQDITYAGSALQGGTTYYWRIKFWDNPGSQSTTSSAQFTMDAAPNAPTDLLTAGVTNPTSLTNFTPTFSAIFSDPDSSDTGDYYQIEVNTASNFSGTVMWDTTQAALSPVIVNNTRSQDITYAGTSLQPGTTYYWRIKFWDNKGLDGATSTAQFTMNAAPSAPTDLLTEGATNPPKIADFTPEFSAIFNDANTTDTGDYYQIEVNTTADFAGTVMWDSTKTSLSPIIANGARSQDISYAGSTLQGGTTYYWRVKFWDSNDTEGAWSSVAQFTMNAAPSAPTNLLTEGATNPTDLTDFTPEFSAIFNDPNTSDTASAYQIEVNTASDFTGAVMWDSTQTTISPALANGARSQDISYTGSTLNPYFTYYWRIRFWDDMGTQGVTASGQFSLIVTTWQNAFLQYKQPVLAENTTGSTLTNEDVLVQLDTATLITAGKMQNDCDDIRFLDNDDSTSLEYWVEGKCNTSSTQIWVRVPSLPNGGKTIFMYYGDPNATNAEEEWTGNVILFADTTCPTGWTRASDLDNKFLYGGTTYGTTGGGTSHTHSDAICTSSSINTTTVAGTSGGALGGSTTTHTHTSLRATLLSTSVVPPYEGMIACYSNTFLFSQGLISMFNTSTPSGWTRYSELDNRFVEAKSTYGETGGSATHTHSTTTAYTTGTTSDTQTLASAFSATGGTVTYADGYTIHTFTTGGTFAATGSKSVEVLVVGGGGGGGADQGGGGGAGGYVYSSSTAVSTGNYTITIGGGGAGASAGTANTGSAGGSSTAFGYTAGGGGGGYGLYRTGQSGGNSGSGTTVYTGGSAYGDISGGAGGASVSANGGNASSSGKDSSSGYAGSGAAGLTIMGVSFGGGGGGGNRTLTQAGTASYGGGNGGYQTNGANGTANTGGGGGGGSWNNYQYGGGTGGSGIVVVRYLTSTSGTYASSTHTHNSNSATSTTVSNLPPYLDMVFAKADSNQYVTTNNVIATSALPPLGWSRFTDLDNKFPRGASTYGTSGGSSTHTHDVTVNTSTPSATIDGSGSGTNYADATHTHSCTTTSDTGSNMPSYSTVIYTQRKTSQTISFSSEQLGNQAPYSPSDLLTEGLTNPSEVTNLTPKFSAVFTDPDSTDSGIAYQIQVSSTSDFSGGIVWDSNQTSISAITNGSRSQEITYAGATLNPYFTYYWRIRFWDDNNKGSRVGAWSTTAHFETTSGTNTWTNANFIYKDPIAVLNPGNDVLTDEDVLVQIDTATLIAAGKMQNDCDDIRFFDSDDSTPLQYWVEGKCNTSSTQIWVRVPSVPVGGKAIFMYYGSFDATNAEEEWTGNVILFADTTCPTGWTRASDLDNRFLYGGTTYGTTGGGTSHTHSDAICTSSSINTTSVAGTSGGALGGSTTTHTHTSLRATLLSTSVVPPYEGMIACYSNTFLFSQGLISMFNTSTPSGWTRYSELDNRFVEAKSTYGETGGSATHTHSTTTAYTTGTASATQTLLNSFSTTGGTVTTYDSYTVHTFTSSGTFTVVGSGTVDVLVVGGGGGGGNGWNSSGGGGGAVVSNTNVSVSTGSITVTVGNGGGGSTNGSASSFGSYVTAAGGNYGASGTDGGGCGGTSGSGYAGGCGWYQDNNYGTVGGGGGGAGGGGGSGVWGTAGNGGTGVASSISGSTLRYGGGGGGAYYGGYNPGYGVDGGGSGSTGAGYSGTANTGGGGGGANYNSTGGTGGSGIVIIRRQTAVGSSGTFASSTHTHDSTSATPTTSSTLPPYLDMVFAKADSNQYVTINNVIATSALPPLGWSRFTDLDNKFPRAASTYGATGGSATHTHDVSITTGIPSGTTDGGGTGTNYADATHTHSCTTTSDTGSNMPSYSTVIYAQRKASLDTTLSNEQEGNLPSTPTSLLTEGLTNPTELETTTPKFSAVFTDPDSTDSAIAYQIQVNTSPSFTGEMVWDSNQTSFTTVPNGNRSQDITYAGTTLNSSFPYYWRIRFWDNNSLGSRYGYWSSPASFSLKTTTWGIFNSPYRFPVIVENNTGSTLTNEDVLVQVDTATLIAAGKMQNDCDDIRFLDNDDSTSLQYWVEGKCNTDSTQIWVRVPSLPNGGKTIFIYYGDPDATNGEQTWSGNIIMYTDTSCPTGWTRAEDLDNKFLYGGTTYGTTGGGTSHTHSDAICTSSSINTTSVAGTSGGALGGSTTTHTHTSLRATLLSTSVVPPYEGMIACYSNTFLFSQGLISMFNTDTPSGWTRYSELDNKFVEAKSTYGETGGSATHTHSTTTAYTTGTASDTQTLLNSFSTTGGTVTTYGSYTVHTFTSSGTFNVIGSGTVDVLVVGGGAAGGNAGNNDDDRWAWGGAGGAGGQVVYTSSYSVSAGSISVVVGGGNANSSFGSITATAGGGAAGGGAGGTGGPTGENGAAGGTGTYSDINGTGYYYGGGGGGGGADYRGVESFGGSGGTSGGGKGGDTTYCMPAEKSCPVGNVAPGTANTGGGGGGGGGAFYCENGAAGGSGIVIIRRQTATGSSGTYASSTHTHDSASATPTTVSNLPPYLDMVFAKADSNQYVTANNVVATSVLPPLGWSRYTALDSKFPRAAATYGGTGGSATHTHDTTVTTGTPSGTADGGGTGTSYSDSTHTHSCTTTSDTGSNMPPYSTVIYSQRKTSQTATLLTEQIGNIKPDKPTNLLTEGLTNPLNIIDFTPEFSALFTDENTEDIARYYQIQVNTTSDFTGTVMWDSTKTEYSPVVTNGNQSQDVSYAGPELQPGTTYYWRIKFWDDHSLGSKETEWSDANSFIPQAPPNTPTSLQTNGAVNPIVLTRIPPSFTAFYSDANSDNATAYQIEVNTNALFTGTVMWDSGKVATTATSGQRSPAYTYDGIQLIDTKNTYYWHIRFWDTIDAASEWSEVATFVDSSTHTYYEGLKLNGLKLD